ncbi:MAG TPA: hypothetical protein VFB02_25455 [Bradyrhizobium sp.]|nr:hypothetical protein [Bradyrhizobium sp.]
MRRVALLAWLAVASSAQAADDRTLLNHCKALVAQASAASAELQHCRQVIKEWTLRDSRMSVDENGRPLR